MKNQVICTDFSNGKKHDFRLFKESKILIHPKVKAITDENVIGMLKRFKIIADKYRNRRKRFGLRFNLISGIYNFELR